MAGGESPGRRWTILENFLPPDSRCYEYSYAVHHSFGRGTFKTVAESVIVPKIVLDKIIGQNSWTERPRGRGPVGGSRAPFVGGAGPARMRGVRPDLRPKSSGRARALHMRVQKATLSQQRRPGHQATEPADLRGVSCCSSPCPTLSHGSHGDHSPQGPFSLPVSGAHSASASPVKLSEAFDSLSLDSSEGYSRTPQPVKHSLTNGCSASSLPSDWPSSAGNAPMMVPKSLSPASEIVGMNGVSGINGGGYASGINGGGYASGMNAGSPVNGVSYASAVNRGSCAAEVQRASLPDMPMLHVTLQDLEQRSSSLPATSRDSHQLQGERRHQSPGVQRVKENGGHERAPTAPRIRQRGEVELGWPVDSNTLYFSNIHSATTTKEELKQRIEVFGKVTNIKVMKASPAEGEGRMEGGDYNTVAYVRMEKQSACDWVISGFHGDPFENSAMPVACRYALSEV